MSISVFPSGNFIVISDSNLISIYDKRHNLIQKTSDKFPYDTRINYVNIKDENNFITCSDNYIKFWTKKINIFFLNAYKYVKSQLNKIEYYLKNTLISCSRESSVIIWNENKNKIKIKTILIYSKEINSFLVIKDKNRLIISGEGIEIRKLKNLKLLHYYHGTGVDNYYGLARLDENRIIASYVLSAHASFIKIISLSENKILESKITEGFWNILYPIKQKNILLVGIYSEILVFKNNDIQNTIQKLYDVHDEIIGIIELKNNEIASFGNDGIIKIFKLEI